ncbi:hypothetical protein ABZ719_37410, partial [Streptomyces sp. NPDC006743]
MNALLSVAFVLCWSSGFIGAKLGAGTSTVTTLLMWRFVPLALVLVAVAPLTRAMADAAVADLRAEDVLPKLLKVLGSSPVT